MSDTGDDALLQQYRREFAKLRLIAEEIQDVLQACRGKVGKTISRREFESLIKEARRRGCRRAGITTEVSSYEEAKVDQSGPKEETETAKPLFRTRPGASNRAPRKRPE